MTSLKFRHIGVAVRNLDVALSLYADLFGYKLLSGPFDDSVQKVSVCFLGSGIPGEAVIELVAPLSKDSPVEGVLSKGGGAYHLCFETDEMGKTISDAVAKGCVIVSQPVPAVAFAGRRIAWFYTPTRQLVEVVER